MEPKDEIPYIRTIEWEMLDKKKFIPLSIASSFTVRTTLYPFTLVKTRLQIQKGNEIYKGTWDAFRKIVKYEGFKGLYKGFWVNLFSIVSGAFYVITYENVRHILQVNNVTDTRLRALIGGGCASLVGQTIIVPIDVISQHLMMIGQKVEGKTLTPSNVHSINLQSTKRDSIEDMLRPYLRMYQVQRFGGRFTIFIKVQRLDSIGQTFRILWREERFHMFTKGLTARIIMSTFYSFSIILGYESVKRLSVKEQYREQIRW
uniref:EOG090X08ST n=1 Tax=Megafenestra aurita TaxID=2291010 RepID=A0A4Y7NIP1_9CRUS|nr:EOG090X08ST [Megafenestra aurita]SVE92484.1 EOG090X08ST [Megafenestra aurita]